MQTNLHAFHDSQELKDLYLARVLQHRKLDELHQGVGWEVNGKTRGCAVGCTLNVYDHSRYPVELGIPELLARLEDRLFELMPRAHAIGSSPTTSWPYRFLHAIDPGANLSKVWGQWAVWMLVDPTWGVIRYAKRPDTIAAIERVAQLWRDGGTPEQFRQAHNAAAAAARQAAAAAAAASWAAAAAAWAAAAWAADAAAAWAADADAAARGKWAIAASDKLIELLEAA